MECFKCGDTVEKPSNSRTILNIQIARKKIQIIDKIAQDFKINDSQSHICGECIGELSQQTPYNIHFELLDSELKNKIEYDYKNKLRNLV
ncbi:hypothetical protein DFO70_12524 [Cytobacillus firmus]|uniref:Uncharacterized protein n=2 Tax=Cytobacillus TaxID=2675230 RepID=A0A366JJL8_CYTFI|nr:hypothetical protein DFO70_12524 [Cytobacillus firmus]TDX39298.1 hypothetical protein DFO72_111128 [Cytobacillus oceanisediminis]